MSIADDIVKIAYETRAWAERYAKRNGYDEQSLRELCGVASAELHRRYKKALIRSSVAYAEKHCFVLVGHFVIDITATQFKYVQEVGKLLGNRVVLVELYETMCKACPEFYKYESKYIDIKKLRKRQAKGDWPRYQWARGS